MNELARRYAEALYALFKDEDRLHHVLDGLQSCPALWDALISPAVHAAEKQRVLSRLPELCDEPVLLRFLLTLTKRGRITILPDIENEFHTLCLRAQNAAECTMTCVRPPDAASCERIKALLCQLHQKSEMRLIIRIDPALLGGFTLELEGITYDQSVRGRLNRLARNLEEVSTA